MLKLISIIVCGFVLGHYFLLSWLVLNFYCSKWNSDTPVFMFWIHGSNGMHKHIYFATLGFIAEALGIHLRFSIIKPNYHAQNQNGWEKDVFSLRFHITVHHQMRSAQELIAKTSWQKLKSLMACSKDNITHSGLGPLTLINN